MSTYLGHPLFGGTRVERTTSSWYKNFWVDIEEGEKSLKGVFFVSVANGLGISCFQNDNAWIIFDLIFISQDSVALSDYSKVKFFLESHWKTFVEHWDTLFLISEEENLGNWRILCSESLEVGVGDFDDVGV